MEGSCRSVGPETKCFKSLFSSLKQRQILRWSFKTYKEHPKHGAHTLSSAGSYTPEPGYCSDSSSKARVASLGATRSIKVSPDRAAKVAKLVSLQRRARRMQQHRGQGTGYGRSTSFPERLSDQKMLPRMTWKPEVLHPAPKPHHR